jgi:hypothetical protein
MKTRSVFFVFVVMLSAVHGAAVAEEGGEPAGSAAHTPEAGPAAAPEPSEATTNAPGAGAGGDGSEAGGVPTGTAPGDEVSGPTGEEAAGVAAAEPPVGSGPAVEMPAEVPETSADQGDGGEAVSEGRVGSLPIGGYGELHFNLTVPQEGERLSVLDLHRLVLFVAHRFRFGLSFQLELEVEHAFVAGEDTPGEVAIEQAYVDYPLVGRYLGVRAGIVLVPMGIINQRHEPPTFHGVERPGVDRAVIPSTWREGGVGVYGRLADWLAYEVYLTTALDAGGFSMGTGIRGGRQHVAQASFDGVAVSGRVELQPTPWLRAGLAGYWGQAGPNVEGLFSSCDGAGQCTPLDLDVSVGGGALDVDVRWRGLEARAVVAFFSIGDTAALRAAVDDQGAPAGPDVASLVFGAYAEVGWDVLSLADTRHQLLPFVRYEHYDTTMRHDDPAVEGSRGTHDVVVGLTYRPIPEVAFKTDVVLRNPGEGDVLFNLGVGWMF